MAAPQPYPPARHMLRDLRLEIWRRDGEVAVRMPAVAALQNRAGAVGAGALGVAVDVIGGNLALRAVQPDWAVTSTLELHLLRPLTRDFEVTGAPLRAAARHDNRFASTVMRSWLSAWRSQFARRLRRFCMTGCPFCSSCRQS